MSVGRIARESDRTGELAGGIQGQLIEFHRAMNVPIVATPRVPHDDRVRLRARLIVEECLEFLEACFVIHGDPPNGRVFLFAKETLRHLCDDAAVNVTLDEAADALADIAYVVESANLEFGIDSGPVLDEVHRANMAKVGGPVRADGKVLKPVGWTPPDIARILAEQSK